MNYIKRNEKVKKTINLDENTIKKCENYSEMHGGLGLSATLRTIVNEFFYQRDGKA